MKNQLQSIYEILEGGGGGGGKPPEVKIPTRLIVILVLAMVLVTTAWSCFYTVEPEEVGVVLRFGEYNRETPPGLHLKMPNPFERALKVPVQRQLKMEFGFRTVSAGVRSQYERKSLLDESLMLTGDLNVAVVEWIAQFRVRDSYKFLFKVRNPRATLGALNEAVMRQVVGDRTVNEVLTIGRQAIASEVEVQLQALCDQYDLGVKIEQVVLQDVNPPDPVKPSFNEVNQAQQEKERLINEALTAYNKVIPRARGEALQLVQEAEGYATDRVNRAEGDAAAFTAVLAAWKKAPEVTRKRIYLETMEQVYPKIGSKQIIDDDLAGILPLLQLGKGGAR
jgi:membrane protease subunit HflK